VVPQDVEPEALASEITSRPPCAAGCTAAATTSSGAVAFQASGGLARSTCRLNAISGGIGHGIDQEGLRHGGEFSSTAPLRAAALRPYGVTSSQHPPAHRPDRHPDTFGAGSSTAASTNRKAEFHGGPSRHAPAWSVCAAWKQRDHWRLTRRDRTRIAFKTQYGLLPKIALERPPATSALRTTPFEDRGNVECWEVSGTFRLSWRASSRRSSRLRVPDQ